MKTVTINGTSYLVPEQADNYPWAAGLNGVAGMTALLQALAAGTSGSVSVGFTTTVSSGTPITLTAASDWTQLITGSSAQTVNLPDATTLARQHSFRFINQSTGLLSLYDNAGGWVATLPTGSDVSCTCTNISSAAGSWVAPLPRGTRLVFPAASVLFQFDMLESTRNLVDSSGTITTLRYTSSTPLPPAPGPSIPCHGSTDAANWITSASLSQAYAQKFNTGAWSAGLWFRPGYDVVDPMNLLCIIGLNPGSTDADCTPMNIGYSTSNSRFYSDRTNTHGVGTRTEFGSVGSVPLGQWARVDVTKTASAGGAQGGSATFSMYLNGILQTTDTGATMTSACGSVDNLSLGGYKDVNGTYFIHGDYAGVYAVNQVLSPANILAIYNQTKP